MAATHTTATILWSAASSLSIGTSSNGTSDAQAINTAAVDGSLTLKADNNGTPAAGDTVDFYILYDNGATSYDTVAAARWLCQLNTNAADPQQLTVPINVAASNFKVYAVNNSSGRAQTVSAIYNEVRA